MEKVEVKIIRNDKKEFFIDNIVWGIPSDDGLVGFDTVQNETYTQKSATGDGSRLTGSQVVERDVTIKARLMNPALNQTMRRFVISFFNPKYTFKVFLKYMGVERWCEGHQIAFKCDNGNIYKPIMFQWTMLCPMPYMLSVDDFSKDIASSLPLAMFPFMSIVGYGFGTGVYKYAKNVEIENDGDVETFGRAVIVANGDVENPKLIKGDKFVRMIDTMRKGDVYELDFASKPPKIKKNGENAMRFIDRNSSVTRMGFDVGVSKIGFDADAGSNNMSVTVYFNKRYLGV